jgi:hypothetical protein
MRRWASCDRKATSRAEVSDARGDTEVRPGWRPPFGTSGRIRNRAIWAIALFAASVPPAVVGLGIAAGTIEQANVAMPLAFLFWALGVVMALWAAFPTLRYWEGLPVQTRWLGALPMLSVSLFLGAVLIGAALT